MTCNDYIRWTKGTTKHGLKLSGLIFTSIVAVIAVVAGLKDGFTYSSIELFVLCLLLGNGFALFVLSLAIVSSYKQCNAAIRFYESIPGEIKSNYGLILVEKQKRSRIEYPNLEIVDTVCEHPFVVYFDDKSVGIILINDLRTVKTFQKRMVEVQKKYKKQHVELTGWGLRKYMSKKEWKAITSERVKEILEELKVLSERESLVVVTRKMSE